MSELSTQAAIVTGGGSGIGAAVALRLARRGFTVLVADLHEAAAERTVTDIAAAGCAPAKAHACDVTDKTQAEDVVRAAGAELSTVINCAGIAGRSARLTSFSEQEWRSVVDVNMWGVVNMVVAATPVLRERRGGSIVNVSSIAGLQGSRGQVAYSTAKASVIGLTEASAKELMPDGIRVNAVAPGFIATPMTEQMNEDIKAAWRLDQLALGGGFGTPDQVAAGIEFLACPESSFVTGVVLPIDGGFRLGYP